MMILTQRITKIYIVTKGRHRRSEFELCAKVM